MFTLFCSLQSFILTCRQNVTPKTHRIVAKASRNRIRFVSCDPDFDGDVKQDAERVDETATRWKMCKQRRILESNQCFKKYLEKFKDSSWNVLTPASFHDSVKIYYQ